MNGAGRTSQNLSQIRFVWSFQVQPNRGISIAARNDSLTLGSARDVLLRRSEGSARVPRSLQLVRKAPNGKARA